MKTMANAVSPIDGLRGSRSSELDTDSGSVVSVVTLASEWPVSFCTGSARISVEGCKRLHPDVANTMTVTTTHWRSMRIPSSPADRGAYIIGVDEHQDEMRGTPLGDESLLDRREPAVLLPDSADGGAIDVDERNRRLPFGIFESVNRVCTSSDRGHACPKPQACHPESPPLSPASRPPLPPQHRVPPEGAGPASASAAARCRQPRPTPSP